MTQNERVPQMRFEDLSPKNQGQARARFFNAGIGDGYLYELNIEGNILCRRKHLKKVSVCEVVNRGVEQ